VINPLDILLSGGFPFILGTLPFFATLHMARGRWRSHAPVSNPEQ
jgi:hypothetical protein